MNIILEKLFKEYKLGKKDIYEIKQIYNFLSIDKKQRLIDNFETIYSEIKRLKINRFLEQEDIFSKTLITIEDRVKNLEKIKTLRELNKDVFKKVRI